MMAAVVFRGDVQEFHYERSHVLESAELDLSFSNPVKHKSQIFGPIKPVWSQNSAVAEMPAAICVGDVVWVGISAAAFVALGAELRGSANGSRGSSFHQITTSMFIVVFDAAKFFERMGVANLPPLRGSARSTTINILGLTPKAIC